ncbi:MAG: PHP domain-containing protein [Methanobrevibacter sp.]|uniref:PHP domain-containing protein n=1 Tax=Methanobrevibacter sp. TaxID=66852 RepID=UPI0025DE0880|nr:PHP domain-containing protein [Methanobrevibacter sp.]MBQ8016485.1 PHP domain-containing protein [Methanobrevibacter sp.]
MYKMDSHIHSEYSPDSLSKIDDILKVARRENIDILAISDHNTVDGTSEIVAKTRNTDILAIPSIEISSSQGHILGFGCEENIPQGLSPEDTIDRIHDLGGLAIVPHPYCFYRHGLLCKSDYKDLKIDAIETKNARFIIGYCNNKAKNLAKRENIPTLGASDAHYWEFVGDCYSLIECEKDIDGVLKAIKKGKVEAHGKGTSNILLSKYLIEKNVLKKFD